ncbi:MAG: hypothetical protein ACFFG0_10040 [Candidatus Thorarchaeota archaeon]
MEVLNVIYYRYSNPVYCLCIGIIITIFSFIMYLSDVPEGGALGLMLGIILLIGGIGIIGLKKALKKQKEKDQSSE